MLIPVRGLEGPHCGLVPLAGPVRSLTTSGLRWNVSDSRMEMGVFVSVCNQLLPSAFSDVTTFSTSSISGEDSTTRVFPSEILRIINSDKDSIVDDVCKCKATSSFANCLCEYSSFGVRIATSDPILWTCEISMTI
jgi:hypothetical protein